MNLRVPMTLICPSCQGALAPRVMGCKHCDLKLEGDFYTNEFASLDERLLHFLRIFIHCEGRIKDMEKALGVSYPTVKATMNQLKAALKRSGEAGAPTPEAEPTASNLQSDRLAILEAMAAGELSYDEALSRLKTNKTQR